MSVLVADPVKQEEKVLALQAAFQHVAQADKQEQLNKFLDSINDAKEELQKSYDYINEVPQTMRELFWFTEVGEEVLAAMKMLLDLAERKSHDMVKVYAKYNRTFQRLGLDRALLRKYKEVADEMKEVAVDLRHRFFDLPQDKEFMDLMQQLSEIA